MHMHTDSTLRNTYVPAVPSSNSNYSLLIGRCKTIGVKLYIGVASHCCAALAVALCLGQQILLQYCLGSRVYISSVVFPKLDTRDQFASLDESIAETSAEMFLFIASSQVLDTGVKSIVPGNSSSIVTRYLILFLCHTQALVPDVNLVYDGRLVYYWCRVVLHTIGRP